MILPDAYSTMLDDNYWKYQLWSPEGRNALLHIRSLQKRLGALGLEGAKVAYTHSFTFSDREATDFIYTYQQAQAQEPTTPMIETMDFVIDTQTRILIDTGHPGISSNYEEAISTIKHARSLTLLTQYPPKGRLRKALAQQQAEYVPDDIRIYTNDWRQFVMPGAILRKAESALPPQVVTNTHSFNRFIHAKLLIAQSTDITDMIIGGSHIFQESLVRMGTADIALQSTDPALVARVSEYVASLS